MLEVVFRIRIVSLEPQDTSMSVYFA